MQTPIMPEYKDRLVPSDEYIDVQYHSSYKCKLCGYVPQEWGEWGCVPRMQNHLKEKHNIQPPEGKAFWIVSYSDSEVKKALKKWAEEE